jgi:hypothetical protein
MVAKMKELKFKATNSKTGETFIFTFADLYGYEGEVSGVILPDERTILVENDKGLNPDLKIELYTDVSDSFFDMNLQVDVLLTQYKRHGKIIVAFDFDDTVCPFRGNDCSKVIELLKRLRPYATLICFTARLGSRIDSAEQYLIKHQIPYDYINKQHDGSEIAVGTKLFYNQLLDDKAGLYESFLILEAFLERIGLE